MGVGFSAGILRYGLMIDGLCAQLHLCQVKHVMERGTDPQQRWGKTRLLPLTKAKMVTPSVHCSPQAKAWVKIWKNN